MSRKKNELQTKALLLRILRKKKLRALYITCARRPRTTFFKFSIHLSVRKSWEKLDKYMENLKQALEKFKHRYAPIFFSTILCFVALVYKSYIFFFRTPALRKLFDFRFSYEHCHCSHVCLIVKMASRTMTRSIRYP